MCYDSTNHRVAKGEGCIGKTIGGNRKSIIELNTKTRVGATFRKNMEEKVLKLSIHNEFLIKEGQQSKMKIVELKKKNGMLDIDLA